MIRIFLSYARADGVDAATRLHNELTAMGFTVWRDLEEMRGGLAWKEQLRTALRTVDAVVVLLTPGAVVSKTVEWEWENALTLDKRVIALLVQPCDVPAELKRLHYHQITTPDLYGLGLAHLVRDLLPLALPNAAPAGKAAPAAAEGYRVGKATQSAIGRGATVINAPVRLSASAAKVAQALAQRPSTAPVTDAAGYTIEEAEQSAIGDQAALLNVGNEPSTAATNVLEQLQQLLHIQPVAPAHAVELQQTLITIAGQLGALDGRVATLEAKILTRFTQSEQTILTAIVTRLDEQDALLTDAILTAVEIETLTVAELEKKLGAIQHNLTLLGQQLTTQAPYRQEVQQVIAAVGEPGLDVRHRLKLTIPLIPILLSYEGEYEFNIRANLEAIWQELRAWGRVREAS